ncbi:hypothetical protein LTR04_005360 [Oleoguttula sp. CCFEE 6159]|nr:hypothetical protein LTR04_005360 [Oleoguttula sp. CCFEE 6159]
MAPSTFASAAAGSNANSTRTDGGGDWTRRTNGATQTFRRPSLAATLSSNHQREGSASVSNPGVYVPPHRNGVLAESRFFKDQLIQLFKAQLDSEDLHGNLSGLYVGGWEPHNANGPSTPGWGRREESSRETIPGADVCWDYDGAVQPLGLTELTEDEKNFFSNSVNSPLKPPAQNAGKENTPKDGASLRKISVSSNGSNAFGLASPTASKPGPRRRETSDSYPFPNNSVTPGLGNGRPSREVPSTATPPAALPRKRTDFREGGTSTAGEERDKENPLEGAPESAIPFGTLKRSTTGPLSAGLMGPSSPWSGTPQSTGFSPMGAFGSFAAGTSSGQASATNEKRSGFGSMRGESRFKGLMTKENSEDPGRAVKEKSSRASLNRVDEAEQDRQNQSWMEVRASRPISNDTDPYPDEPQVTGSAALGGGQDTTPPRRYGIMDYGTPSRQASQEEHGFSAFGMTSDTHTFRDIVHGRDNHQHHTPQHRGPGAGSQEPMSPTDTNPYQSPEQQNTDREETETDGYDTQNTHLPGLGGFGNEHNMSTAVGSMNGLGNLIRAPAAPASDRSQTSSTGPTKGFPNLGGVGGLPGLGGSAPWTGGQASAGTPSRERTGFQGMFGGEGLFGSTGELQSPNLSGLGSSGLFGPSNGSGLGAGRGGKLGSLFPAAMQEQMRGSEQARQANEDGGVSGKGGFPSNAAEGLVPARETDSPFRPSRGFMDDLLSNNDTNRTLRGSDASLLPFSAPLQTPNSGPVGPNIGQQQRTAQPQAVSSSTMNQPPAAQQRQMVMPDRMRWIYRDPQGVTQGPWSGLEMHDWYKAGFFSPELLVKKFEDPDYEPLAQLIRRIGNSREPFLVPQIGIPHGQATTQGGNAWAGQGPVASTVTSSAAAQPPFPSSFPSFGTTLTAEQQNALERRKQEEQYLMARQKEHLAQQQVLVKMQLQGPHGVMPQQLQHRSSAHSLQSQPSFSNITSPAAYQPSPVQGSMQGHPGVPGFFDNSFRPNPAAGIGSIGAGMDLLGNIREEEIPALERLNLGRGAQPPFGGAATAFGQQQQESNMYAQQVAAMLNDRSRLQREQAEYEAMQRLGQGEQQTSNDRLQQFHELRSLVEKEDYAAPPEGVIGKPVGTQPEHSQHQLREQQQMYRQLDDQNMESQITSSGEAATPVKQSEVLSLAEQVQKAASAKQSPAPQSPWAKMETVLPQPFPPAPSQSPLPAPAAQRNRQNVADALNAESHSRSQTSSVDTPGGSLAPWAKELVEAPKGPSLREIQEAEARKAAQAEEVAAAARRAALEREVQTQVQAVPPAPGLPSSSTWASANGASPTTASASTPSAWVKPLAGKPPANTGLSKKTLQQIQKEEEARKQKVAAASAASTATAIAGAAQMASAGKRYADLASKVAGPALNTGAAGAWTTVGSSGKVKSPASAASPTGPTASRVVSAGTAPSLSATVKKPSVPSRSSTLGGPMPGQVNAQEKLREWAVAELRQDLNKGISETDIVTEAVHTVSQTIDSRHFAEEFIRRRKLADKGIVDNTHTHSVAPNATVEGKSGGWSEVAKKNPASVAKEEPNNFKVVAAKKKSGKR